MSLSINIQNTKNIKCLDFCVPKNSGVYLLVGPNGAGKTTLLSCLDRIGNPHAFARNFISSNMNVELDQYKESVITYDCEEPAIKISFRKKNKRWAATPKRMSKNLVKFGYNSTVFIQADAKRISVPSDEIQRGKFVGASQSIVDSMNELFETKKYLRLKRLRNTFGRGKKAQYYYVMQEEKQVYSEKRFSTGELALLRLVERLADVEENSLILLDEAELALHPRIQKNLLDYLKRVSEEKKLTVIIATHSVTMIKATDKYHILMLEEKKEGVFEVVSPCYSAKALGSVDFMENSAYDAIIFVEDDMAKLLMKKMLNRCKGITKFSTINVAIIPVGGYKQTSDLALTTKGMLFNQTKVFAVWDADVFDETMKKNSALKNYYENHSDVIFNLKCTPELWMITALESEEEEIKLAIRNTFNIDLKSILCSTEYKKCNCTKQRQRAKDKMNVVLEKIKNASGESEEIVLDRFSEIIISNCYDDKMINDIVIPMIGKV